MKVYLSLHQVHLSSMSRLSVLRPWKYSYSPCWLVIWIVLRDGVSAWTILSQVDFGLPLSYSKYHAHKA